MKETYYSPNVTVDGFSETLESPAELHDIKNGESREYVVDLSRLKAYHGRRKFRLSEMTDSALLPPGSYTLTLDLDGGEVVYLNRSIEILSPNEAEQNFLQEARSQHQNRRDDRKIQPFMNSVWETFVTDNDLAFANRITSQLGALAEEQLSYHLALGKAIRGQEVSEEQPATVNEKTIRRFYEANIKLLQYQIAETRGDKKKVLSLEAEVLRLRPHWNETVLDEKRKGRGVVEYFKSLRDQRKQGLKGQEP